MAFSHAPATTLPQQQDDEHHGADDAEDQGDRHLERHDDGAADEVADGDDGDAEQAHPRQVAAQVVAAEHRDDVGHDQPEERQVAHHHGDHAGGDRNQARAEEHHPAVVESDVGRDVLAEPSDGEAVRDEEDGHHHDQYDPQHL